MRKYFISTQCKLVWKTLWLRCMIWTLVSTSHQIYDYSFWKNYSREVFAWRKVLAVINVDTLFGNFGAIMAIWGKSIFLFLNNVITHNNVGTTADIILHFYFFSIWTKAIVCYCWRQVYFISFHCFRLKAKQVNENWNSRREWNFVLSIYLNCSFACESPAGIHGN